MDIDISRPRLLNIGFGNKVAAERIVAIVTPGSAPVKRLKDEARKAGRLVNATQGRKTRSVLIMDSKHLILSAIKDGAVNPRAIRDKVGLDLRRISYLLADLEKTSAVAFQKMEDKKPVFAALG